ncbi:MAG: 1-acyl-sn-glycerol-3-phosphate acyltransferase [Anaerolineales bacterium]|nr:1-acyl-sn-glycerol-3-phosphate acyltransferase [Anaerolineales bacterium]
MTILVRFGEAEGLENVPRQGPGILLINHIAFVDPIMVLHALPRQIVPLAKAEVYDYPGVGIFPKMWGVIPIHRDEVDRRAIQRCLAVLRAGELILVAPEGTRSPQLQQAREGIAYLASRSGAPVIPVAIEGTEGFPAIRFLSSRWRGPAVHLKFGRPFRYRSGLHGPRQQLLRQMADDAMYVLAGMLPEKRRGHYADLSQATQETIEWL